MISINISNEDIWFLLHSYYTESVGVLNINGSVCENTIKITRGVKQGVVLSPTLFNFFIDNLLSDIHNSNKGCHVFETNTTILGYCDDLILLTPSLNHMKELINKCVEYSDKWFFKFNPKKSVIINSGYKLYRDEDINIFLKDTKLEVVKECKYLGIYVNEENDGNDAMLIKFSGVEKAFFSLNSFGIRPPGVNPTTKAFIYNNLCLPKCSYGMGIYNLTKNTRNRLNVKQNNIFRYALGIPYKSHTSSLMKALNVVDIETLFLSQSCILVKILHRHEYTKKV